MTAAPPSPPTPDRVAEIAARLEAATPVFWTHERGSRRERGFVIIARPSAEYDTPTNGMVAWVGDFSQGREQAERDAAFIAHAPADVTWLLGEVERLTAEAAAVRAAALEEAARVAERKTFATSDDGQTRLRIPRTVSARDRRRHPRPRRRRTAWLSPSR